MFPVDTRFPRVVSGASSALSACGVSLDTLFPQDKEAKLAKHRTKKMRMHLRGVSYLQGTSTLLHQGNYGRNTKKERLFLLEIG